MASEKKRSAGLTKDLTAEKQRAEGLTKDLTDEKQRAEGLTKDLTDEKQRAEGLTKDLTDEKQRAEGLTKDLTDEKQRAEGLTKDLTDEKQRAEGLTKDLTDEKQRAEGLTKDLTAEKQRAEGLTDALKRTKQNEATLEKRISLLNCRLKVEEIKPSLEKLREELKKAEKSKRWWSFAETAIKAASIILSVSGGLPGVNGFPGNGSPFSNIHDLPDDFDAQSFLSENAERFENLLAGFDGVPDLTDQELNSIPLENLETYKSQLISASQELDAAIELL